MPSVDEPVELGADEPRDLAGVLGHRAGVHRPRAGVGVRRRRRVHAVGEAAALADLVEQPARQAAAEDVVDDVERLAVGVARAAPNGRRWPGAPARSRRRSRRRSRDRARGRPRRCGRRPPGIAANASSTAATTSSWSTSPATRPRSWRRCGSGRRRTRGCRRPSIDRTVPAPRRCRGRGRGRRTAAGVSVRRATSSGESSSIASSSRITWRSLSTSSSVISERVSTSPSSSMPVAPWRAASGSSTPCTPST